MSYGVNDRQRGALGALMRLADYDTPPGEEFAEDVENVLWGSQYDFAQITAECDRVIAFN